MLAITNYTGIIRFVGNVKRLICIIIFVNMKSEATTTIMLLLGHEMFK